MDVLVPFRAGEDLARDQAWQFVRAWYREQHPDCRLIVGECHPSEPWSKGVAVARAFTHSTAPIVAVADADVLVTPGDLTGCVNAVGAGAAWAQPHNRVFRLSRAASAAVYRSTQRPQVRVLGNQALERRSHAAVPGGGLVVCARVTFESVGGPDPRFVDWGGDDVSWARALDTLAGRCARFDGPMWHFWHPRAPRRPGNRASRESEALAARYIDAYGNVAGMRELVDEHRDCRVRRTA